jgi:hypothetical protein
LGSSGERVSEEDYPERALDCGVWQRCAGLPRTDRENARVAVLHTAVQKRPGRRPGVIAARSLHLDVVHKRSASTAGLIYAVIAVVDSPQREGLRRGLRLS